jgi:prepilin-type N-terminal cleavage/methylation domain-containing protein
MIQQRPAQPGRKQRRSGGFTLIELLMVIAIITILASVLLVALFAAEQSSNVRRTQQQIDKIHRLLMTRVEHFQNRPIPVSVPPGSTARQISMLRLLTIRELMRMELPDRRSDVAIEVGSPVTPYMPGPDGKWGVAGTDDDNDGFADGASEAGFPGSDDVLLVNAPRLQSTSLWRSYNRRVQAVWGPKWFQVHPHTPLSGPPQTWTPLYESSECLYMILANIREGDRSGLDFFTESEIGDVDGDQMPEILDSWGKPIEFLRWAPGYIGNGVSTLQFGDGVIGVDGDAGENGNIMDPLKVDPLWTDTKTDKDPFTLVPLVFSAGPDGIYDVMMTKVYSGSERIDGRQQDYPDHAKRRFRYTQDSYIFAPPANPSVFYPNNPYYWIDPNDPDPGIQNRSFGDPDLTRGALDNISNHFPSQ